MSTTAHYCIGLVMLCLSAFFAIGLGSLLQYRAIARGQAAQAAYVDVYSANLLPPIYRKASF